MKYKFVTFFILLCVSMTVFAQESTRKERNFIKEGNEFFSSGEFKNALSCYRNALSENPKSEAAMYNIALVYTKFDLHYADSLFSQCVDTISNSKLKEKCYYNLGNISLNIGDSIQMANGGFDQLGQASSPEAIEYYKKSISHYKDALRLNPENNNARYNLRVAQLRIPQNENQQSAASGNQGDNSQEQDQNREQNSSQSQANQEESQEQATTATEVILQQIERDEERTRRRISAGGQNTGVPSQEDDNAIDASIIQQKPW